MKKLFIICFALLLVVALALSAAACNGVTVTTEPDGTVTITPSNGEQSGSEPGQSQGETPADENGNDDHGQGAEESGSQSGEEGQTPSGEEQGTPSGETEHQPTITDINVLINRYPTQAKTFGDALARAVLRKYDVTAPIYCGYSFNAADENAALGSLTVSIATKIDATERKVATYKITFDSVTLDKIADGTYTLSGTRSSFLSQQTYNAEEKQNDADFLSGLYEQDDFVYVAYVAETFEGQGNENGNEPENGEEPAAELTIEQLIAEHGAEINANLATHYENVLKKAYAKSYGSDRYILNYYQWDLGEVEDSKIKELKLTIYYYDTVLLGHYLRVYQVSLAESINFSVLTNQNEISSISANYTDLYTFAYNELIQGTRTDLVNAILAKAITDDFDYQNAEIIFKDNGSSTTSDFGIVRRFVVVIKNSNGIRTVAATIQTADTDEALIAKLQQGKGSTSFSNSVTYSTNQLPAVDPNAPAQGSAIQTLITEHGAEINANLATQYDNVLKDAFGKKYSTRKDYVTDYQWDLGEVNDNNGIQNIRLTFNYQNGSSAGLYVYNVNFNNPVNINDLKNSNISNVTASYTQDYLFSYDNTIQGTRANLVNAILAKAITDDFDYQNAEIIFKDNGSSTNAEFGSIRNFTIIVINSKGIREIATAIQSADSDAELVAKLQQGKGSINFSDKITYSQNLIAGYNAGEAEMSELSN